MNPPAVRVPRRGLLRTSAGVALALLVALLAPVGVAAPVLAQSAAAVVAAAATATDVGRPSWWVGDCDSSRWGPIAASMGWTGVGSHRMGATYLGVPVCGPRPAVDGSPDVMWGRAGWGESEWQCVELAQRFMAQVYGTTAYGANGSDVVKNYSTAYGGNLVKIANGTVGKAPIPGMSSSGSTYGALDVSGMAARDLAELIGELTDQMHAAAAELQFEVAARLRDEVSDLKKELRQMQSAGHA